MRQLVNRRLGRRRPQGSRSCVCSAAAGSGQRGAVFFDFSFSWAGHCALPLIGATGIPVLVLYAYGFTTVPRYHDHPNALHYIRHPAIAENLLIGARGPNIPYRYSFLISLCVRPPRP